MRISVSLMKKKGFAVEIGSDYVEIFPIHPISVQPLIDLLMTEYGVGMRDAHYLADEVHELQVFAALRS